MPRTVLEVAQAASYKLGTEKPENLFASTDRTFQEVASLLNEVSERIVRAHDWSLLKTEATDSGDGSTIGFNLPSDYLRMPKEAQVWSTRWQRPLLAITPEEFLRLDVRNYDLVTGTWVQLNGQMKYSPALATGEDARWYYISNAVVAPASGSNKASFTADDDTFRLDDRVLELQLIWEWRHRKGQPYAEDMKTAEIALAQAISEDGGAGLLTQSSRRNVRAKVAYPWSITP